MTDNHQQQSDSGKSLATIKEQEFLDAIPTFEQAPASTDMIPRANLETYIAPLRSDMGLPIQDEILINHFPDPSLREMLADYYSREPVPFKKFANKTLPVLGMILWEKQSGWNDKKGLWHDEGYFQVRMLVEDEKGEIVLVQSSGAALGKHIYHVLVAQGWYWFKEPVLYRFEVGADNSHRMINPAHDLRKLMKKTAKV